jgi:hypothetical protein
MSSLVVGVPGSGTCRTTGFGDRSTRRLIQPSARPRSSIDRPVGGTILAIWRPRRVTVTLTTAHEDLTIGRPTELGRSPDQHNRPEYRWLGVRRSWKGASHAARCLEECRSPLGFVLQRWQGLRPAREAVALGVAHGLFCVGCCWSLMLVMFGLGLGSLAWMLAFGTVMAVEKNLPRGRRLGRPLGLALLAGAVWIVAT